MFVLQDLQKIGEALSIYKIVKQKNRKIKGTWFIVFFSAIPPVWRCTIFENNFADHIN